MLLQINKTSAKLFFMNHFINTFSGCGFCRVLAQFEFVFQKKAQTIGKCLKVEGYTPVPKHREERKSFLFFFKNKKIGASRSVGSRKMAGKMPKRFGAKFYKCLLVGG